MLFYFYSFYKKNVEIEYNTIKTKAIFIKKKGGKMLKSHTQHIKKKYNKHIVGPYSNIIGTLFIRGKRDNRRGGGSPHLNENNPTDPLPERSRAGVSKLQPGGPDVPL